MKIDIKINNKPFKESKAYDVLYFILCLVRLLVMMPLILLCYFYVVAMFFLGTKNTFDKFARFIISMALNEYDN